MIEGIQKILCGHIYGLFIKYLSQNLCLCNWSSAADHVKGHGTFWTWDLPGRCKGRGEGLRGYRLPLIPAEVLFPGQCHVTSSCHMPLGPCLFCGGLHPPNDKLASASLLLNCLLLGIWSLLQENSTNTKHMLEITVLLQSEH